MQFFFPFETSLKFMVQREQGLPKKILKKARKNIGKGQRLNRTDFALFQEIQDHPYVKHGKVQSEDKLRTLSTYLHPCLVPTLKFLGHIRFRGWRWGQPTRPTSSP